MHKILFNTRNYTVLFKRLG